MEFCNSKKEYEVPVLSNGRMDDLSAVRLILTRWIQENDYGYLDRNYQPRRRRAVIRFLENVSKRINEAHPGKIPVNITLSRRTLSGYPPKRESV